MLRNLSASIKGVNARLPRHYLQSFKNFFNIHSSYGLDGLDTRLLSQLAPGHSGFFVELGAYDGKSQSNTYVLQKNYGWTGILIEPSPIEYIKCIDNRSFGNRPNVCCAACVPFGYNYNFVEMEYAGLMSIGHNLDRSSSDVNAWASTGQQFLHNSTYHHSFGAKAKTLNSILLDFNAPKNFDLLSLDVEGNELSVLKGLDFNTFLPKWILVEVNNDDKETYDLLLNKGYSLRSSLTKNDTYSDLLFTSLAI